MVYGKNAEGYADPTASGGIAAVVKDEKYYEKLNSSTIFLIKNIADLAGFDVCGRITLKHRKTGKVFK